MSVSAPTILWISLARVLAEAMTRSRSAGSFSSVARVENITETLVIPPRSTV